MINRIKKFTLFIFLALISTNIYAQVPQGFNFQAIARGSDGIPLISQELGVQVSVLQGSEAGDNVYTETHTITTNGVGLIQLVIGEGAAAEANDFSSINWGNDNYYVKLEIDPTGGTDYEELGVSRLLSVPYALLAQNVINGGLGGNDLPLELNLNTANPDSSFIINIEGDKTAKPLQVFSRSTGFNGAIWGEAISEASNPNNQRGTYGFANGAGTGQHAGVFGGAVNFDATGGSRTGLYGQAASKAKYNFGVQALAQGDGSGEIVPIGEEVDGNFGSYNIAGGFYARGNLNGNVGVEAQTAGENGNRADFGVIARAIGTGNSPNVGIRSEANSSPVFNTALEGEVNGTTKNLGLRLNVHGGTSNVGMEVNADTAAIFNGNVIVNGNLVYSGMSVGSSSTSYALNTADSDSSFTVDLSGPVSGTAVIATSSTNGTNAGLEGHAQSQVGNDNLQVGTYGESRGTGGGTHMGIYGVALGEESGSGDGGRRYGLYGIAESTGRENIGGFGIGKGAGDGEVVALGDEFSGGSFNVGGFNIGFVGFARDNVNGNIGLRGYVYGDQGARENRGVSAEAVSTGTGQNVGVQSRVNSSQTKNIGYEAFVNSASPDNLGMFIEVSEGTNSNIGLIVNAETAAELNGNTTVTGNFVVNGNIEHTGSITQTSDLNLKENIQPLKSGLSTIMKLNPTSYNFRGNGEYNGLKLSTGLHYGLIAQEVEEVLPNLVKDNVHHYEVAINSKNGPNDLIEEKTVKSMDYKTMNYTELIPVLIKAVQEQQDEIEELKKEVERLKSEKK